MAVDYDLVIIGSSPLGIYAAETAIYLKARVAIVTQNDNHGDTTQLIFERSLNEIGRLIGQNRDNPWGINCEIPSSHAVFEKIRSMQQGANNLDSTSSLKTLAALGVDVIFDRGGFFLSPQLSFVAGNRNLRARSYLLATGSQYIIPSIESNSPVNCLTYSDLSCRHDLKSLPEHLAIVGNSPQTWQLVQNLARLSHKIDLIIPDAHILPQEDREPAMLIQGQLEAEGVKIFTDSPITRIEQLNDKKWIQASDQAIETDEIIFTDCRQPNIAELNLAEVNVKYDGTKINVNNKLQTTNPKIYACGDLLGGYYFPDIERYEVSIAIKNALLFPCFKTNYRAIPWSIKVQPGLARVGMSERQARSIYGDNLIVIKKYDRDSLAMPKLGINTDFCQLLVRPNGGIIGCTLIGEKTTPLISLIALAIKHKIKLDRPVVLGWTDLDLPNCLQQLFKEFYAKKLINNSILKYLENWYELRRSWSK
jgi:pyruvate/2-oxoglutarate dehydrogenase complex dihydrolipoamide dehydrogenase (E3) component